MYTLDIIVPCYNEEEVIDTFYDEITKVVNDMRDINCRFIFIDDGSKDKTLDKLKKIACNDKRAIYLSFSRNFGKEAAILAGFKFTNADFACLIDADLQHPPAMIPEMLKALTEEDYDVAAARRTTRSDKNKFKNKLSESFYKAINKISDTQIEGNAQDFRILKHKVVNAILCMHEYNRFSKGIFSWVGYRTKWFEHEDAPRAAGETKWTFKMLLKYALNGIINFSDLPLKLPLYIGMILSALSFIAGLSADILSNIYNIQIYSSSTVLLCLCTGLILMSAGILGTYLSRIFSEIKHRPDFIINKTNVLFNENSRLNYTFDVDEDLSEYEDEDDVRDAFDDSENDDDDNEAEEIEKRKREMYERRRELERMEHERFIAEQEAMMKEKRSKRNSYEEYN